MGCTSPHNLGNLGHNDTSDFKIRLLRRRPLFELSLEDDTAALRCHYCFAKLVRLYGYTVDVDVISILVFILHQPPMEKEKNNDLRNTPATIWFSVYFTYCFFFLKSPIIFFKKALCRASVWFAHSSVLYENGASNMANSIEENPVHLGIQCKRLQFRAFRLLGFGFTIRSEWPDQKQTGLSQSIHTCYYSKCVSTCISIALLLSLLYTVCKYTPTSIEQAKCFLQKERNSFMYDVCQIKN